ncbi:MAG: hypothetical protein QOH01_2752 [Verrucomicrobiota bacterium]
MIPAWCLWTWAMVGIIAAAFFAWRDEHRKVKCKSRRAILTKVVDAAPYITVYEGIIPGNITTILETIGALIAVCDELGDESDVEWICQQLSELKQPDMADPFALYECFYGAGAFKGKRLKFLRDARVSSGTFIKNDIDAIGYIRTFWGAKNGLREINQPIYPVKIVNGRLEYLQVLCRPLSSAKEARLYLIPPTLQLGDEDQLISTPLVLPTRPQQPENETLGEDDFATLFVPDPSGSIPGVAKQS